MRWVHFDYWGQPIIILTISTETTPGVYQASGYGDLTADKSMWSVLRLRVLCTNLMDIPPTGSGSSLHAIILKPRPSLHGSTVA